MKKLKRNKQCAKCPWKVSTDPKDIPNNYSVEKHKKLGVTIWGEKTVQGTIKALKQTECRVMACHESDNENDYYCVGWLHNQLGIGNNIMLRLQMLEYDLSQMEVFGEQHNKLEDTIK